MARARLRWLDGMALATAAFGAFACEESKPIAATPSAEPAGGSSAPPSAAPAAAAAPPAEDLDVAAIDKALECGDKKEGACGVLAAYAACKPWDGSTPSGDGRWIGKGFTVTGDKVEERVTLLRSRRVAASEVGPGQVPARIGFAEIASDHVVFPHALKAVSALARHDVPAVKNQAMEHVATLDQWDGEAFATRTEKGHVFVLHKGGGYVCTGEKQQLVLILRTNARGAAGDGLYAELWPTTW